MNYPADYQYTRSDEWISREGNIVTIGITDYAQSELGELVFAELPEVGAKIAAGTPLGVVESVKAVAEILSPLGGEVVEINQAVADEPSLVNDSPFEQGWLARVKVEGEIPATLMSESQYRAFRSL